VKRLVLALFLVLAVLWPAAAAAAGTTAKASLELLVLLPQKHNLAVFEQVEMAPAGINPAIGLVQGFKNLEPINVKLSSVSGDAATITGSPSTIAVKYTLPWDGTSTLLQETLPVATSSVVIMVPESLALPSVVNPNWTVGKSRKIPGLPNSPTFRVYSTSSVTAEQSIAASVESASSAAVTTLPPAGFPLAGRAFEFGLGLLLLAGALVVVNWRPLTDWRPVHDVREGFIGRLATLESERRRGDVSEAEYRAERSTLLARLEHVWTDHRD
jgi:hypothetical protein